MNDMRIPDRLILGFQFARRIAVLTGAGVSVESGIPTFRDAQTGLWSKYRPEDLATPEAFQRDPKLVWEWYAWRRELVAAAEPNPGHYALARIEESVSNFTLITQNVDNLHFRAGSKNVIELHGNIQRVKCFDEGCIIPGWEETGTLPPACPQCGGMLRPDVVWFGEMLPLPALESAYQASASCDIFLSIGTSVLVQPAASLPLAAMQGGAIVVEINPQETPLTGLAAYFLKGPSGVILPKIVNAVWG